MAGYLTLPSFGAAAFSPAQHTYESLHLIERVANEMEPSLISLFLHKEDREDYAYLIWECAKQEVRLM